MRYFILTLVLLTGCTQGYLTRNFKDPVTLAKEDCASIGYRPGTQQYMECVERTSYNIRNARAVSR
jgi:hypothetical protein